MLQERRNKKIGILIVFITDRRDLAGGKAACAVSRRCIWGSLGRNQCAVVARAAHILCVRLSDKDDLVFYETCACPTTWSGFQGALMSVDPFPTQLWAASPNACGPLRQGSAQMWLSASPLPSPGLGTQWEQRCNLEAGGSGAWVMVDFYSAISFTRWKPRTEGFVMVLC